MPVLQPPTTSHATAPDGGRLPAIGWAFYVACSWTWCIGMYLPVLMVRDFGAGAWLVFAIPNVLGAGALGWVLHRPGAAARLARQHWHAAALFSLVTVLFQVFFIGWVVRALIGEAAEVIAVAATAAFYFAGRRGRRDLIVAAVLWAISLTAFIIAAGNPDVRPTGPIDIRPTIGLFYLAPVCAFGFLLCPYLDLTFLRARASMDAFTGISAFTIGFGMLFVVMVLFTLWYSNLVQPATLMGHALPPVVAWMIAGHMVLQASFTTALHSRALSEDPRARQKQAVAAFLLALVLAFLLGAWSERLIPGPLGHGETIYRLFMGFYGLVFPAYVWLFVAPSPGRLVVSATRRWIVFAIALAIAGPMFWMGFIEDRMMWLAPGLGIVLLSKLALFV